jgi:hypothetical protein
MITAVVRYKLPPHIDYAACREHFHKIAPDFREVTGLISKHFIWTESGWAGGVYQWNRIEDAKAFYAGPWLDGIIQRYGMKPEIDLYEVFAVTDNTCGKVELFKESCKLVGTVKGTRIWAGECFAASPAESPAEPGGASPPGEKQ